MQVTGHTRLGCLLGSPVAHSISPMVYNEAFRLLDIDSIYLCFDTKDRDLCTIIRALRELNTYGFNVTMPDKERVMEYLDEVTEAARMIGAVNTVTNENGRLIGHNTDGTGYVRAMQEEGYRFDGITMTLLGAGGAASAIAVQSALSGVSSLYIVNRKNGHSFANAMRLADQISARTDCRAEAVDLNDTAAVNACIGKSSLLTNATSVGMSPKEDALPLSDLSCLRPDLAVTDIIYHPQQTRLLTEAKRAGCRTANGMYMLLYQGEAAFRIWTGQQMPVEEIRAKYFTA